MGFIARIFLMSVIFFSCSGVASTENQLSRLANQIKNIKNALQQKHSKRDALQHDLDQIDTQYGEASQRRQQIEQDTLKQQQQIAALENASSISKNQIQLQQAALAEQLRLSYLLQRQGAIKLFLNQEDFGQMSRMLYYYQTLNVYRTANIQQLQSSLEKIIAQQKQLYAEYQNLKALQLKMQTQEKQLNLMKDNRTQLIASINHTIRDQNQVLENLNINKKRLEQTLVHLTQTPAAFKGNFSNINFARQRGHLPWPTKGKVLHYFNTPIADSELKWSGELIEAPDDQPVYAVAPGTIIFSKWLEGYGLLIIINHGQGYMSLYGRNHSLYKHEGDKVSAGDLIATVGQSGGYDKPALFFAIRYNAKPLDPNQWCT